uniref:Uncharacterized protein n=1 Tax=Anguilla anguilla TaxID=7936 RepID=A0A0E9XYS8_ANGAN
MLRLIISCSLETGCEKPVVIELCRWQSFPCCHLSISCDPTLHGLALDRRVWLSTPHDCMGSPSLS